MSCFLGIDAGTSGVKAVDHTPPKLGGAGSAGLVGGL